VRKLIPLTLCLAAFPALASPPQAALSWTAPTTNTDGSAITVPLTYNIYQGLSGSLTKVQSGLSTVTVVITAGLTPGTTQCFAVTAIAAGQESAQSSPACAAIPFAVPGSPGQVTVVVTGN
jgi:hypothetical protein